MKTNRVRFLKTSKDLRTLSSANKIENTSGKHLFGTQVIGTAPNHPVPVGLRRLDFNGKSYCLRSMRHVSGTLRCSFI